MVTRTCTSLNIDDEINDLERAERRFEMTDVARWLESKLRPAASINQARLLSFKGGVSTVRTLSRRRRWVKLEREGPKEELVRRVPRWLRSPT